MRSASRTEIKQAEKSTSDQKTGKNVVEASALVQKQRGIEKTWCWAEEQRVHRKSEQPERSENPEDQQ